MFQIFMMLIAFVPLQPQLEQPLPDRAELLAELRKTLRSDSTLLSQYTYTEKETELTLDSKGQTKKTETNVYQVIHGAEEWKTYRRLISKNNVPLDSKELDKQDRKEKERVEKETRKRENQSEAKRLEEKEKAEREERDQIDDIFATYDFQLLRREARGGVSTILVSFAPGKNYKPKTSEGKLFQHIAGRVWVAEDDHELVRLEAEVVDPISIGAGLLAKLQKGSSLAFERRKINNEIWLPVKAEASLTGRLLLLKGINMKEITEYSDHRKYGVDIQLKFDDPQ